MALPRRKAGVFVEFQPMSPEEIERTVQFLLHSQGRFEANFEKLSAKTDRIADGLIALTGIVGRVNDDVGQLAGHVGGLAAAQQETDRQLRETKVRLDEVGEYIKTVESHLNVLIEMFERHGREDHGRRPS